MKGEQMSLSGTQSVDRRDAAVAAALCGAVVVLLAYSAGVGIQVPGVLAVAPPAPAAPVVVPVAPPVVPVPASQPAVQVLVPGPATQPPLHEHPEPAPSPSPAPTPEPTLTPPPTSGRTCAAGVLTANPTTEPVASLVATLARALPVLHSLAAPPEPGIEPGPLSCVVGAIVATQCCTTAATGSEAGR